MSLLVTCFTGNSQASSLLSGCMARRPAAFPLPPTRLVLAESSSLNLRPLTLRHPLAPLPRIKPINDEHGMCLYRITNPVFCGFYPTSNLLRYKIKFHMSWNYKGKVPPLKTGTKKHSF